MPQVLTLAQHTLYAELMERALDMFDEQFPENGSISKCVQKSHNGKNREYFYYIGYRPGLEGPTKDKRYSRYVGPADDPEIAGRVARFKAIKAARKECASIVGALAGAGLARPPMILGRIAEAMARAGVFRLGSVLIETAAFQTYPAVLGYRLSHAAAQTGDVDRAQARSISIVVNDKAPPVLDILKDVDPSFGPVQRIKDPVESIVYRNAQGFGLDIVTTYLGSGDQTSKPTRLPALERACGEPLGLMNFLVHKPVSSVLLHGSGVAINVPAPERFAVHKLIISKRRPSDVAGQAKARQDLSQARQIIEAMRDGARTSELNLAIAEAMARGPKWRAELRDALSKVGQLIPDRG